MRIYVSVFYDSIYNYLSLFILVLLYKLMFIEEIEFM